MQQKASLTHTLLSKSERSMKIQYCRCMLSKAGNIDDLS